MDGISSYMSANLNALQQTLSMAILDKAMHVETAAAAAMIDSMPAPVVDGVGANVDVLA